MDLDLARRWITRWEGCRDCTYLDTKGIPTIGVGLNLQTNAACNAIAALGLDLTAVRSGSVSLTTPQIDQLLDGSIQDAVTTARALIPEFDTLPDNQQLIVTDLSFNMGQHVFSEFQQTIALIRQQDWTNAAAHLSQSVWFHQVGSAPHQRGGADVAVLGNTADPATILQNG